MSLHQKCNYAYRCKYASETVPGTCGYHHCRLNDNSRSNNNRNYNYTNYNNTNSCRNCANRDYCDRNSSNCNNYIYDM